MTFDEFPDLSDAKRDRLIPFFAKCCQCALRSLSYDDLKIHDIAYRRFHNLTHFFVQKRAFKSPLISLHHKSDIRTVIRFLFVRNGNVKSFEINVLHVLNAWVMTYWRYNGGPKHHV